MITWIENNLIANPRSTMGRPIAASADHTPLSFTVQWAAIILPAALLLNGIMEVFNG